MADKDQFNEEYQYTEIDPMSPSPSEEGDAFATTGEQSYSTGEKTSQVKRNAIIAILVFIGLMIAYKFIGSYFFAKKEEIIPVKTEPGVPKPAIIVTPTPEANNVSESEHMPSLIPNSEISTASDSKLSTIVQNQDNLNQQILEFNNQMTNVNSTIDHMSTQLADLNRTIEALNEKLNQQAIVIEHLTPKPPVRVIMKNPVRIIKRHLRYYAQAVIPGRAWLVAANGSTITVREGSVIPGYGQVKMIDPNQGRVYTSSGKVIRFSQDDS